MSFPYQAWVKTGDGYKAVYLDGPLNQREIDVSSLVPIEGELAGASTEAPRLFSEE